MFCSGESISLSKFKENITINISGHNEEVLKTYAYRIDGQPSMAKDAGLGTLCCCDYLYINNNQEAVLIEDTNLGEKVRELKAELKGLKNISSEEKIIKRNLKQENYLKVYGAFIILDYLKQKYKKISRELIGKSFSFWFIINDEHNIKAIDNMNLVEYLKKCFASLIGTKLVKNTKVLLLKEFKEELQS